MESVTMDENEYRRRMMSAVTVVCWTIAVSMWFGCFWLLVSLIITLGRG